MTTRRWWVLALVAAALILLQASLLADSPQPRKLVVIVANRASLLLPRAHPDMDSPEVAVGLISANDPAMMRRIQSGDTLGFDLSGSIIIHVPHAVIPKERLSNDTDYRLYKEEAKKRSAPVVRQIASALQKADVVVVDVPWLDDFDAARAERNRLRRQGRHDFPFSVYEEREIAPEALGCVRAGLRQMHPQVPVVVTLSYLPEREGGKRLTPIIITGLGEGVLTSWSTRTEGLIAASDLQPTLLSILGKGRETASSGRPAYIVPAADKWKTVSNLYFRTRATRALLIPVLLALAAIAAPGVTIVVILLGYKIVPPMWVRVSLILVMLFAAVALLSMLVFQPGTPEMDNTSGVILRLLLQTALAAGLLLVLTAYRHGQPRRAGMLPIVVAYALTALVILIDALAGANLCKFTILSYQMSGHRFYGVGNEYASVFIVMAGIALSVAASWNRERVGRITVVLVGLLGLVFSVVLGMGWFGANFGACLACAATFFLITVSLARGRFGPWHVVLAFVVGAALSGGLALLDAAVSGSHASHAARAVAGGGGSALQHLSQIAMRKALMGLRILFSHYAVLGVLPFVPFLWLWMKKIQPLVREFLSDKPILSSCLKAIVAGSVIAFLTNDSGIVMVAFMIGMTMLFLLYCLWERVVPVPADG